MKPPLIGITSSVWFDSHGRGFVRAYAPNANAIAQAGGLPVFIPSNIEESTLRCLYERMDGILLPGGGDIDPVLYGAQKHPATQRIDRARDDAEIAITRWAVEDDRPVLGICRGHQVFNVALGGTLLQDIPSQMNTNVPHDFPDDVPRSKLAHGVHVIPDSRLAQILGETVLMVNSLHHQAVDLLAPVLRAAAYSTDGIVEAVEIPDHRFSLSVQWHPEDLTEYNPIRRLFQAFVDAARDSS